MAFDSVHDAVLAGSDFKHGEFALGVPRDMAHLHARLRAMAHHRPASVAGVLEHWLATPHGESDFDVKS